MKPTLLCSPILFFAAGLSSQSLHLVGPGGHADVDAALAVAAPGDVIEVLPGGYPPFHATIGVTIRRHPSATLPPEIGGSSVGPTTVDVPAGQVLGVVGIRLAAVEVVGGRATLENCVVRAAVTGALLAVRNATVHLVGCNVVGNLHPFTDADALVATNADVTAVSTSFTPSFGFFPGTGIRLLDARLHASDVEIYGGSDTLQSVPALIADGSSRVWLADSFVASCCSCAIQNNGATIRLARSTVVESSTCTPLPQVGPLLGVEQPAPPSLGSQFGLVYRTEPDGLVFVFVGFALDTIDWTPLLEQPSWLSPTGSFVAAVVPADGAGVAAVSFALPASPALADTPLWFKGIGGNTFPLQASPVAGGLLR